MPRVMQRVLAAGALMILGPLLLALAIAVRLTSPGPALHRATRMRPGETFTLYKLRTMRADAAEAGPGVTAGGDPRVTTLGRYLRRAKLDELPQLWNVVRGDMLLVGPRPEDPRYFDAADPLHGRVFSALPGITGPTALAYRDEETLLEAAALEIARADGRATTMSEDVDTAYRNVILPAKLARDAAYLAERSFWGDVLIMVETVVAATAARRRRGRAA